jgi:protein-tyrosine phosphatase
MAAVLVLLALGAPQEAIVQDYLASNERWQPTAATRDWTVLSRVRAQYLQTAFDTMVEHFGSIDAYLHDALALDAAARERLAAQLLSARTTPA